MTCVIPPTCACKLAPLASGLKAVVPLIMASVSMWATFYLAHTSENK